MAKAAKRKKEKDDSDFAFPEFDEAEYMRKELEGAKAAVVSVILAIGVAAVLYALTVAGLAIVAFFLGVATTFALPQLFNALRVLPWPKVDTTKFERRDWIGHGSTFLFSWLAFWILLLNTPFADLTAPVVRVTAFAGVVTKSMTPDIINQVDHVDAVPVQFNVTILENVGIDQATITILGNPSPLQPLGGARYEFRYTPPLNVTSLPDTEVFARDTSGHETSFSFTVQLQ